MRWDRRVRSFQNCCIASIGACLALILFAGGGLCQTSTQACFDCHSDPGLLSADGRHMTVLPELFKASVHGEFECVDCHAAGGNFEDVPHFDKYVSVDCSQCHEQAVKSYAVNFHARARERGNAQAPACADCHGDRGDPHGMRALTVRASEDACRRCHATEAAAYDGGVHARAAAQGKKSPGCVSCHASHGPGLPPSAGTVNKMCESCHPGAMADVKRGGHIAIEEALTEVINCASCHDVHGTHKPQMSARVSEKCVNCHAERMAEFKGSAHEGLFEDGTMSCLSCHSTHKNEKEAREFDAGCGACHSDVEQVYRNSVHRLGRLRGDQAAATCADCHNGHHVIAASDTTSDTNYRNIPKLCGKCHGADAVVTREFVRLPISLPNYLLSVHGKGWKEGKRTAVCTDCHGTHDLQNAQHPESSINRFRLADTCGKCHSEIAAEYHRSVHGRALGMGLEDSPTCTTCHDEHLIRRHSDPKSRVSAEHRARELCGDCHTDSRLIAKYGIPSGVVESYLDTYHGWALERGSRLVANCTDCHNVHEIRARQDSGSSINPANVTATCGRCHAGSNPTFARSYTHAGALRARGYHDIARMIYLILISVVLGGMAVHNFIIARHELAGHLRRRSDEPYVVRWTAVERMQHLVLLGSFIGLAVTGFALRFPSAWWVKIIGLGGSEVVRASLHRALAVILIAVSVYHVAWVLISRRGRVALRGMAPRGSDLVEFVQNMAFHLRLRRERPAYDVYDYTQKAEYWALVWGTWVMALTGFVLWIPTIATSWLPAWTVRVSEVVHFYEAILAVSAIVVWHFFYVIFLPSEYPMSTIWLNGRLSAKEWKEMHRREYIEAGDDAVIDPKGGGDGARGKAAREDTDPPQS
jgi:cytochrome b subunit of formate dehydrogenase